MYFQNSKTGVISKTSKQPGQLQFEQNSKKLMDQLKNEKIGYFINSNGEPVIHIPDDPHKKYWPADHDRVQSHIAMIYHDVTNGGFLKPSEFAALMSLLKAECYRGGQRFTEMEGEEAEKDPIVQALINYCNKNESFSGMTFRLLNELISAAMSSSVEDHWKIPRLTNIFSRRLNRLKPTLLGLGIKVSITHSEAGSHCDLVRLPEFNREPDAFTRQAPANHSDIKPYQGRDYVPADGTDGFERFEDGPHNGHQNNNTLVEVLNQLTSEDNKGGAA